MSTVSSCSSFSDLDSFNRRASTTTDEDASFSSLSSHSASSSPSIASVRTAKVTKLSAISRNFTNPPALPDRYEHVDDGAKSSRASVGSWYSGSGHGGRTEGSDLDVFKQSLEDQETELNGRDRLGTSPIWLLELVLLTDFSGPRMKLISPAPWDMDEEDNTSLLSSSSYDSRRAGAASVRSSSAASASPSKKSRSSSRVSSPTVASFKANDFKVLSVPLQGLGIAQDSVSNRSTSSLKSLTSTESSLRTSSTPPHLELGEVGLHDGKQRPRLSGRPPLPTSNVFDLPATPFEPSIPRSAPANMTSFASPHLPHSGSNATIRTSPLPLQTTELTAAFPSLVSPTSISFDGVTTSPIQGQVGYKLISLAEARQREDGRIARAAAKKQAMLPVEHIAGRDDITHGTSTLSPTASTSSALVSITSSASTPPPLRIPKHKKSGFLRRMIPLGDSKHQSNTTVFEQPASEAQAVIESFRALPDDYVHTPNSPTLAITPPILFPPSSTSWKPSRGTASRLQPGINLAPSLSLRPVSMAFSSKLPQDFLHTTTIKAEPTSPRLPPSPLSTSSNWSIFDEAPRSPGSIATTPVSATFSPRMSSKYSSPSEPRESTSQLLELFAKAKNSWESQQRDLEAEVHALKEELHALKTEAYVRLLIAELFLPCRCFTYPRNPLSTVRHVRKQNIEVLHTSLTAPTCADRRHLFTRKPFRQWGRDVNVLMYFAVTFVFSKITAVNILDRCCLYNLKSP